MELDARKPGFWVRDQAMINPVYPATETSKTILIWAYVAQQILPDFMADISTSTRNPFRYSAFITW